MMKDYLLRYFPGVYDDFIEIDLLTTAEGKIFNTAMEEVELAIARQYIVTADEIGITAFENILSIAADPTSETLEFRRQRLLNRWAVRAPLSTPFLRQRLDEIIGADAYELYIDYNNYTLYVEASAINQQWFEEITITISRLKPANIVFINKPLVFADLLLSEQIDLTSSIFNYRLGTRWRLGRLPFRTIQEEVTIKLPEVRSIQPQMMNDVAAFCAEDIASALVNGHFIVDAFVEKSSDANVATVEYFLRTDEFTDDAVTNIKFFNAAGEMLTESIVYVPTVNDMQMKHRIIVAEGVT